MPAMWLVLFLVVAPVVEPIETGWRPIPGPGTSLGPSLGPGARLSHSLGPGPSIGPGLIGPRTLNFHSHIPRPHMCSLYKAVLDQDMFQQYVQYKTQIPDLKEFTLCLWHKFYNHSTDQPLFSYAHRDRSRGIYSWVANSDTASFYMFAVNGQTLYRLNYPVRLHKWYHMCQSWNGKTGEWQIWVNAERIGRGFHNLLVGKPVKGGGMAISGQEQQKYGSGVRKVTGLLGEVTLVQLYKAALTAGKAYTNHKHHHVHHFHHEDKPGDDDYAIASPPTPIQTPPPPPPQSTQFPFLSNGQLIPMLPISELTVGRPQSDFNFGLLSPYNGQLDVILPGMQRLFKRDQNKQASATGKRRKKSEDSDTADTNIEDISKEDSEEPRKVKRDTTKMSIKSKTLSEEDVLKENDGKDADVKKRQTFEEEEEKEESSENKNHKKRTLFHEQFQYGLIPGDDLSELFPGNGYILGGGGIKFDDVESNNGKPTDGVQMEPAEWEVRSIMEVCSGCSEDPFRKANIISWRETPKKLFAGAKYIPAIPECQRF